MWESGGATTKKGILSFAIRLHQIAVTVLLDVSRK